MSDEEKKNGLGRPQRLFENLIFVKCSKTFDIFVKARKSIVNDILLFLKRAEAVRAAQQINIIDLSKS